MTLPPQLNLRKVWIHLAVAAAYAYLLFVGDYYFEDTEYVGHFEPACGLLLAALLIGAYQYA